METHSRFGADEPERPGESSGPSAEGPADAFKDAAARLAEIREYISYYVAAKKDALKLSARNAAFFAVLGILGLLAGCAMVVMAVALLSVGAAHGIGAALGDRWWLGDLIVGVAIFAVIGIGVKMAMSKVFGASRRKTVSKYESRKRDQRIKFGRDVIQHAQQVER